MFHVVLTYLEQKIKSRNNLDGIYFSVITYFQCHKYKYCSVKILRKLADLVIYENYAMPMDQDKSMRPIGVLNIALTLARTCH